MLLLLLSCLHVTAMVLPTKGRIQTLSTPDAQTTPTKMILPSNSLVLGKTSPLSAASASFSTATQVIGSKLPDKEKERFGDFLNKITPSPGAMDLTAWTKEFEPSTLLNKLAQTPSTVEEETKPAMRQTVKIQAVRASPPKKLQIAKEAPITPVSEDVKNVLSKVEETKNAFAKKLAIPEFDVSAWVLKNTPTDTNKDFDLGALVKSITPPTESVSKDDGKKSAVKRVLKKVPMKASVVPKKLPMKTIAFKQPVKAAGRPAPQQTQATVTTAKQTPAVVKVTIAPEVKPVVKAAAPKISTVNFKPVVKAAAPKVSTVNFKPIVKAAAPKVSTVNFKPVVKAAVKEEVKSVVKPVEQKKEAETKQFGNIFVKPAPVVKASAAPVVKAAVAPVVKEAIKPVEKPVVTAVDIKPVDIKPVDIKPVAVKAIEPKKKAEVKKTQMKTAVFTRSSKGSSTLVPYLHHKNITCFFDRHRHYIPLKTIRSPVYSQTPFDLSPSRLLRLLLLSLLLLLFCFRQSTHYCSREKG